MQTWLNDLSNRASERSTQSILRRPPLTGMTTICQQRRVEPERCRRNGMSVVRIAET